MRNVWTRQLIGFSVVCAWLFSLTGCGVVRDVFVWHQCNAFRDYVDDSEKTREIVEWADQYIFSRTFSQSDITLGAAVGPGRLGALSLERTRIALPDPLRGYEIRPLGNNLAQPAGVFIGPRSFRGLIVSRGPLTEMLSALKYTGEPKDEAMDRVIWTCYKGD